MTTELRRFSVFLVPAADDRLWAEGMIRELAARYGRNRDGYTDAKTDFVESILKKAQASKNHML